MAKVWVYLLCSGLILSVYSASILDMITGKEKKDGNDGLRNCICNGPSCICCIDFNVSYIDLGGPGCVRLNYVAADRSIDLNVSYGDSLLHSEKVTGPSPDPTCLNLLSTFAQICARFNELIPTNTGLRGCLLFEPTLLGESQIEFPVGCFHMDEDGMRVIIDTSPDTTTEAAPLLQQESEILPKNETDLPSEGEESGEIIGGLNAEEILAAVNESASQGIAILSNWFGLSPTRSNKTVINDLSSSTTTTTTTEKLE